MALHAGVAADARLRRSHACARREPRQGGAEPGAEAGEARAFSVEEVDAIAAELGTLGVAVIVAAWTGLRPEEWIGLERSDVDRANRLVHVRRVYTAGTLKLTGKQAGSLRAVPLPPKALPALDEQPARLDSRRLFPGRAGGHLNLSNFRVLDWKPALRAAGVDYRLPYALRHSYATWSIGAAVRLFELARLMGTSLVQIDRVYGHLQANSLDRVRSALDSIITNTPAEAEGGAPPP